MYVRNERFQGNSLGYLGIIVQIKHIETTNKRSQNQKHITPTTASVHNCFDSYFAYWNGHFKTELKIYARLQYSKTAV